MPSLTRCLELTGAPKHLHDAIRLRLANEAGLTPIQAVRELIAARQDVAEGLRRELKVKHGIDFAKTPIKGVEPAVRPAIGADADAEAQPLVIDQIENLDLKRLANRLTTALGGARGVKIAVLPDGSLRVRSRSGNVIGVRLATPEDMERAVAEIGRRGIRAGSPLGWYDSRAEVIYIRPDQAGTGTINHELVHAFRGLGVIGDKDVNRMAALLRRMRPDVAAEIENIARTDSMGRPEEELAASLIEHLATGKLKLGKITPVQRVLDLLQDLAAFLRLAKEKSLHSLLRGVSAGAVFNKPATERGSGVEFAHSKQDLSGQAVEIPPGMTPQQAAAAEKARRARQQEVDPNAPTDLIPASEVGQGRISPPGEALEPKRFSIEAPVTADTMPTERGKIAKFAAKMLWGEAPKEIFLRKVARDSAVQGRSIEFQYAAKRLDLALAKEDPAVGEAVQEGLTDPAKMAGVPEHLRPIVEKMRAAMDALSDEGIRIGLFPKKMVPKIQENKGRYLFRSYKVHEDAEAWRKQLATNPELAHVIPNAVALIKQQNPDMADVDVNDWIQYMLHPDTENDVFGRATHLGRIDTSLFKQRQDIPDAIRELLGEIRSPVANFAKSAMRLVAGIETHKMLKDLVENGLDRWFFQHATGTATEPLGRPTKGRASPLGPLAGLWTTPEIRDAITETYSGPDPLWLRTLGWVNGFMKLAKTAGNVPQGPLRNFFSGALLAVANGHMPTGVAKDEAVRLVRQIFGKTTEEDAHALAQLTAHGVLSGGMVTQEMRNLVKDAIDLDHDKYGAGMLREAAKVGKDKVLQIYELGDQFWRLNGFFAELTQLNNTNPAGAPKAQDIDSLLTSDNGQTAAKRVSDLYPTWARLPRFVQELRRVPFLGTFTGFITEVPRISANNLRLGLDQWAEGGKARFYGARRLILQTAAMGMMPLLAKILKAATGVTDDEDEKLRRSGLADWSKNASILHLGKTAAGEYRYTDLSWIDPYSIFSDRIRAMKRGRMDEAAWSMTAPYVGLSLPAQAAYRLMQNDNGYGAKIYHETDSVANKLQDMAAFVWRAMEPGTLTRIRDIKAAAAGEPGRSMENALMSLAGPRMSSVNMTRRFKSAVGAYLRRAQDATTIYTDLTRRPLKPSPEELAEAEKDAKEAHQREEDALRRIYNDAIVLGVPEAEAQKILRESHVTPLLRWSLKIGDPYQWKPPRKGQ